MLGKGERGEGVRHIEAPLGSVNILRELLYAFGNEGSYKILLAHSLLRKPLSGFLQFLRAKLTPLESEVPV